MTQIGPITVLYGRIWGRLISVVLDEGTRLLFVFHVGGSLEWRLRVR
jgi:hypothetical protein